MIIRAGGSNTFRSEKCARYARKVLGILATRKVLGILGLGAWQCQWHTYRCIVLVYYRVPGGYSGRLEVGMIMIIMIAQLDDDEDHDEMVAPWAMAGAMAFLSEN